MYKQVIAESVQQQDDDALLKSLIDMCESTPKFLRSQVTNILDMCLKVNYWFYLVQWILKTNAKHVDLVWFDSVNNFITWCSGKKIKIGFDVRSL